ncbi:hypothetical protein [Staphylococcus epidermidis]|uniref:hypothetical protein n=1 Tax=Staphylococcus epidermidis TaxID=1282 RepID=UPI000744255D|nr:hypothetical protein [Staphylococcus epidermidis]CUY01427.1 hypothetical protein SETU_01496 [Staphylococcus epidermidis]
MLESNLSIIASISTILVSFFSIFLKKHSNNNNQKIEGNNNNVNNEQSITYNENNSYNDIKDLMKSQSSENEILSSILFGVALLVSITIFIKYNHWIISFSCILTLLTSIFVSIRLKKYHLSMKSFGFYTVKYTLLSIILFTGLIYNPTLVANLEKILPPIDKSNSIPFITSILTMSKATFMYFKSIGFLSYDFFVIIFRFLSLVLIYLTLYRDIEKKSFLKKTLKLYKDKWNFFFSYFSLIILLCIILYLMHFEYFQLFSRGILNQLFDWLNLPHK